MRQLTDSEMAHCAAGWRRHKSEHETEPTHIWPFEHGFIGGLDTAAEQVAALMASLGHCAAERTQLRAESDALKITNQALAEKYDGEYLEVTRHNLKLIAERDSLRAEVKDLEDLRDYLSNALQDEAGIQKNMREANAYLARERKKAEAALAEIAAGNPAPPGGTWLSDAKMAQIARRALEGSDDAES